MSNLRMPVLQVGLFEGAATSPDLSLEAVNAEGDIFADLPHRFWPPIDREEGALLWDSLGSDGL